MKIELSTETDFEGWREAARFACSKDIPPQEIVWESPESSGDLFASVAMPKSRRQNREDDRKVVAPRAFLEQAQRVICLREPERFSRLYTLLYRYQKERSLFANQADPDVCWLSAGEKLIRRDIHKMHAFVRFRKVGDTETGREQYGAWFEPTYRIIELATPFFQRRFANMHWTIVTPEATAIWDGARLHFGPGGRREDVPADDDMEDAWRTYFSSIFNPARLKVNAMTSEMPKKYWKNLPEAQLIPGMIKTAQSRARKMAENAPELPNPLAATLMERRPENSAAARPAQTLQDLRRDAEKCTRCELSDCASQTVFGEGPAGAELMIVGEQPGDREDISGKPFVGPAGQLLDECLSDVGIDRARTYVTNAVKHFRFEALGKRRLHKSPSVGHIQTCRWWVSEERRLVRPKIILALGATAVRSLLEQPVALKDLRGQAIRLEDGTLMLATVHPSYLLRLSDDRARADETLRFKADLAEACRLLAKA